MNSDCVVKHIPFFVWELVRVPTIAIIWESAVSRVGCNVKLSLMLLIELLHELLIECSESSWHNKHKWNDEALEAKDHSAKNHELIVVRDLKNNIFHF